MPTTARQIGITGDPRQLFWRGPCPVRCGGRGMRESLPSGAVKVYCDTCDAFAIVRSDGTLAPPVDPSLLPEVADLPFADRGNDGCCQVPGCWADADSLGLCSRHHSRWAGCGRPDVAAWIAAGARTRSGRVSQKVPRTCAEPGCTNPVFSTAGGGDRAKYCGACVPYDDDRPPVDRRPKPKELIMPRQRTQPDTCRVDGCDRRAQARGLCSTHYGRWSSCGKPDVDKFIADGAPQPASVRARASNAAPPPPPKERAAAKPAASDSKPVQTVEPPPSNPARNVTEEATVAALLIGQLGRMELPRAIQHIGQKELAEPVDVIRVALVGDYLTITDDDGCVLRQLQLLPAVAEGEDRG